MALFELNRRPTRRQLRQFGVACLVALPLLGWFWGGGGQTTAALVAVGLALALLGAVRPKFLRPVYVALSIVAIPFGVVIGELILLFVFFGLLLPLGLVFRALGRDALELRWDRSAATYWQAKQPSRSAAHYFRQS
jgi:hypothetical protein